MKSPFAAAIFVVPLLAIFIYILTRSDITGVIDELKDERVGSVLKLKEDRLVFTVDNATRDSYSDFILGLRDRLRASVHPDSGIEVLPDPNPSTLPMADRFFEVDLVTSGTTITLGIDRSDVYIVGYRVRNQSYFFQDTVVGAMDYLFRGTTQTRLNFTSNYNDLEQDQPRSQTNLGFPPLQDAIQVIDEDQNTWNHRRYLLVIIQMIAEATRFPYIKDRLRRTIRGGDYDRILPDATMLELERRWRSLSRRVQEAVNGVFRNPIAIPDRNGVDRSLTTIAQVLQNIAVMKFICTKSPKRIMTSTTYNISRFDSNIILDLEKAFLNDNTGPEASDGVTTTTIFNNGDDKSVSMISVSSEDDDDDDDNTCTTAEVTVSILGRDGLCVDVNKGRNNDGNPIILYPCGSQENQQWTLKNDGTIQSLGKCMTAYGYSAGVYVMIYDCETAARDATLWSIWPNGTISLANHPLVLTAKSSDKGTTLTVEDNTYASSQGWQPNTNLEPFVVSIVGFRDLCLQGGSEWGNIWIDECSLDNTDQQWAIYGDGTIRKNSKRDLCVTADVNNNEKLITLRTCNGWFEQRWVFRADGFIWNPRTGLVMDVFNSQPELHKIILFPPGYTSNQKWLQLF